MNTPNKQAELNNRRLGALANMNPYDNAFKMNTPNKQAEISQVEICKRCMFGREQTRIKDINEFKEKLMNLLLDKNHNLYYNQVEEKYYFKITMEEIEKTTQEMTG